MEFALRLPKGTEVNAREAVNRAEDLYYCSSCFTRVFVRVPVERDPHFYHQAGVAIDCPLRSGIGSGQWEASTPGAPGPAQLWTLRFTSRLGVSAALGDASRPEFDLVVATVLSYLRQFHATCAHEGVEGRNLNARLLEADFQYLTRILCCAVISVVHRAAPQRFARLDLEDVARIIHSLAFAIPWGTWSGGPVTSEALGDLRLVSRITEAPETLLLVGDPNLGRLRIGSGDGEVLRQALHGDLALKAWSEFPFNLIRVDVREEGQPCAISWRGNLSLGVSKAEDLYAFRVGAGASKRTALFYLQAKPLLPEVACEGDAVRGLVGPPGGALLASLRAVVPELGAAAVMNSPSDRAISDFLSRCPSPQRLDMTSGGALIPEPPPTAVTARPVELPQDGLPGREVDLAENSSQGEPLGSSAVLANSMSMARRCQVCGITARGEFGVCLVCRGAEALASRLMRCPVCRASVEMKALPAHLRSHKHGQE